MAMDTDFKFEKFETYFGNISQVRKQIDDCNICGGKLMFTHLADYKNLYVQETARCPECAGDNRKMIHILN